MRIYIESTIPSYLVARPARDLLQAARQQLTKDSWDLKRANHELFTSQVVLDEIAEGEAAMAQQRLAVTAQISLLDLTGEANALTKDILGSGLLPSDADRGAHLDTATELPSPPSPREERAGRGPGRGAALNHIEDDTTTPLPIRSSWGEGTRRHSRVVAVSRCTPDRDAAHIALATVHQMDILLSWNCRHIANAAIQARLRRLVENSGFVLPVLCTPDELTGELYE
jgi:hypothetical protein